MDDGKESIHSPPRCPRYSGGRSALSSGSFSLSRCVSVLLNVVFLVGLLCVCIHNGSAYYIQVFSRQYMVQFNDEWAVPKQQKRKKKCKT